MKKILLVQVAYNNLDQFRLQHKMMQKFYPYEYRQFIVNNCPTPELRQECSDLCEEIGAHLIPYFRHSWNCDTQYIPSWDHATALDYGIKYARYSAENKWDAIATYDPDVFPARKLTDDDFEMLWKYGYYGHLREDAPQKFIGVITFMITRKMLGNNSLSVLPMLRVIPGEKNPIMFDTGATVCLEGVLKDKINYDLFLPKNEADKIINTGYDQDEDYDENYISLINNVWIHIGNACNRHNRDTNPLRYELGVKVCKLAESGQYGKLLELFNKGWYCIQRDIEV